MGNDLGLSSHTNRLKLKMSHNALKVCDQSLCYKSSKFVRAPITSPSSSPLDPSNTSELLPALTKDPQMLGGDTAGIKKIGWYFSTIRIENISLKGTLKFFERTLMLLTH